MKSSVASKNIADSEVIFDVVRSRNSRAQKIADIKSLIKAGRAINRTSENPAVNEELYSILEEISGNAPARKSSISATISRRLSWSGSKEDALPEYKRAYTDFRYYMAVDAIMNEDIQALKRFLGEKPAYISGLVENALAADSLESFRVLYPYFKNDKDEKRDVIRQVADSSSDRIKAELMFKILEENDSESFKIYALNFKRSKDQQINIIRLVAESEQEVMKTKLLLRIIKEDDVELFNTYAQCLPCPNHGNHPNIHIDVSLLQLASRMNSPKIAALMIDDWSCIHQKDELGKTPIHYFLQFGHYDLALRAMLHDKRTDPNYAARKEYEKKEKYKEEYLAYLNRSVSYPYFHTRSAQTFEEYIKEKEEYIQTLSSTKPVKQIGEQDYRERLKNLHGATLHYFDSFKIKDDQAAAKAVEFNKEFPIIRSAASYEQLEKVMKYSQFYKKYLFHENKASTIDLFNMLKHLESGMYPATESQYELIPAKKIREKQDWTIYPEYGCDGFHHVAICHILIIAGASLRLKEKNINAFEIAAQVNAPELFSIMIERLREESLKSEIGDILSRSLLWAVYYNNHFAVDTLLSYGADPLKATSFHKMNAAHMAEAMGYDKILDKFAAVSGAADRVNKICTGQERNPADEYYHQQASFLAANMATGKQAQTEFYEKMFFRMKRHGAIGREAHKRIVKESGNVPASWRSNEIGNIADNVSPQLKQMIQSGKPIDFLANKKSEFSEIGKGEFGQIVQELTMLALTGQRFDLSLESMDTWEKAVGRSYSGITENEKKKIKVIVPPAMKGTLICNIMREADHFMKHMVQNAGVYLPPERQEHLLNNIDEVARDGDNSYPDLRDIYLKAGGIDLYGSKEALTAQVEYNLELKDSGRDLDSYFFASTNPDLYFTNEGGIGCRDRFTVKVREKGKDGKLTVVSDFAPLKKLEERMRTMPECKALMGRMDMIYQLYPIIKTMVECGRVPDLSQYEMMKEYKHYDELAPIVCNHSLTDHRNYADSNFAHINGGVLCNLSAGVKDKPVTHVDRVSTEKVGGLGVKSIHKNSLEYAGPTHVYAIYNETQGFTHKIGESAQGFRSDGSSIRATQQARRLMKETGDVYETRILAQYDTKRDAREREAETISRYRSMHGESTLPGNKNGR